MYQVYRAAIESDGLSLSTDPAVECDSLRAALDAAADTRNHGPDGAAIVCPDDSIIYTGDEYRDAEAMAARSAPERRLYDEPAH